MTPDIPDQNAHLPPGFSRCEVSEVFEDRATRREALSRQAPGGHFSALPTKAQVEGGLLRIAPRDGAALHLSLPKGIARIFVGGPELAAQRVPKQDELDLFAGVYHSLLPDEALFAFFSDEDWHAPDAFQGPGFRLYALRGKPKALVDKLEQEAESVIRGWGCAQGLSRHHPPGYRAVRNERGAETELRLGALLDFSDIGGVALIVLRIMPLGESDTLLVVCATIRTDGTGCSEGPSLIR